MTGSREGQTVREKGGEGKRGGRRGRREGKRSEFRGEENYCPGVTPTPTASRIDFDSAMAFKRSVKVPENSNLH